MVRPAEDHTCSICGRQLSIHSCSVLILQKRTPLSRGYEAAYSMPMMKLCDECAEKKRSELVSVRIDRV